MAEPKMPHPAHEHIYVICTIWVTFDSHLEDYKSLIKNPQHVCKNCGRGGSERKESLQPRQALACRENAGVGDDRVFRSPSPAGSRG